MIILWFLGDVLLPFVLGGAIAYFLDPVADRLERLGLSRVAATRAETLMAVQHLTTALLAAVGGRAMERGHPAQRLSREAQFYVIQAQNEDGRRAMLDAVAGTEGALEGAEAPGSDDAVQY